MTQAYYDSATDRSRSRLDRLADKAPEPMRHAAGQIALAADKAVTALEKAKTAAGPRIAPVAAHVKQRRVPYALAALAVGIGVGLLMHGPSRRAAGGLARKALDGARGGFGAQLSRELQSLFRR